VHVSSEKHWSGRRWLNNTIANKRHNTAICHFETLTFGEFLYIFSFFCHVHVTDLFFVFPQKNVGEEVLDKNK
jgi:hypothetical protein